MEKKIIFEVILWPKKRFDIKSTALYQFMKRCLIPLTAVLLLEYFLYHFGNMLDRKTK